MTKGDTVFLGDYSCQFDMARVAQEDFIVCIKDHRETVYLSGEFMKIVSVLNLDSLLVCLFPCEKKGLIP